MGRYSYHRLAAQEFLDAVTWYGSRDRAVGLSFVEEVDRAIGQILEHPEASPCFIPRESGANCCNGFPTVSTTLWAESGSALSPWGITNAVPSTGCSGYENRRPCPPCERAVADLGRAEEIGRVFAGFQKYLYQQQAAA